MTKENILVMDSQTSSFFSQWQRRINQGDNWLYIAFPLLANIDIKKFITLLVFEISVADFCTSGPLNPAYPIK